MLARSTIDKVEDLSLSDVIGKYITLTKKGANYSATSPFNESDNTPSFVVSPGKHCWKCFSTGFGGASAIGFVMKHKNLSYPEAVIEIAENFSIVVEYDDSDRAKEAVRKIELKKTLSDVNLMAMEFYIEQVEKIPTEKRRASEEAYKRFNIGYAPEGGGLIKHLQGAGISNELMIKAGLVGESANKSLFEIFRNRIMFPVYSHRGHVVGFSGRYIGDKDAKEVPKVLNTKETELFHKSEVMLGLWQSIQDRSISQMKTPVIVEGNFDLTAMFEQEVNNTVATLGTALTAEHAKLLKRFTDTICIAIDNDKAGRTSLEKSTKLLLEHGFKVMCFVPYIESEESDLEKDLKTDPFDMINSKKWEVDEFYTLLKTSECDAVEKLANSYFNEAETVIAKAGAQRKLTELLACVEDTTLRNAYIKEFAKQYGVNKRDVEETVKESVAKKIPEQSTSQKQNLPSYLKEEDLADFQDYGFYAESSPTKIGYWFTGKERVSNFVIKPIFQVSSTTDSKRIVEIQNKDKRVLLSLPNKSFVSPQIFEELVMNYGNFDFQGSAKQFKKIRQKILEQFPFCEEIKTLGWQRDGFWAFADGIISDGLFKKIDSYGICHFGEKKYFLPAFSSIYNDLSEEDDEYEADRYFKYRPTTVNFQFWAAKMQRVYHDNGRWAVLFAIASMYRDFIFKSLNYFPYLYHFGQVQTGKSTCARSLNSVFFGHQPAFNLSSGTNVGFFRRLARTKNAPVWFDEYTNDIDEKRFQALKSGFDGVGYERGVNTRDNRTEATKVNAPGVISGQYLPTRDDNSLFTRCIVRTFARKAEELTQDDIREYTELSEMEKKGLSQIIIEVIKYRDYFEAEFETHRYEVVSKLKEKLNGQEYKGRIMDNYAIVITMAKMFEEKLSLPFTFDEIFKEGVASIISQSEQVQDSDALRSFWKMVEGMSWNWLIKNNQDYIIKEENSVNVRDGRAGSKLEVFTHPTKVLYIRFSQVHTEYMKEHRKVYSQNGVPEQSIMSYMKTSKAFIGNCAVVNFSGNKTSAYAFKYEELSLNLREDINSPNTPDS